MHVIWIALHVNEETRGKTIISRIKYSWYMSNKPASYSCKKSKDLSHSVFSNYLKLLTILKFETGFSKHNFKRTRWFLKICKIFDKLSRLKIRELLPHEGRKNLVTSLFSEQRIKEKLNTRFDYYFWECCLLNFVVACFAVGIVSFEMPNLVTDSPYLQVYM